MDYMTTVPRTLVNVQQELSDALQRKTRDMLKIGSLLNEAKTLVEHGEWLPWLRRHTALPARTAQQYVAWADAKNATVAYLDLDYLSPGAIYALASGRYTDETVEQVLAAAATRQRHIGEADVREIAKTGAKAAILQEIEADEKAEAETARAARQANEAKAERERVEAEAILDGGPDPALPPASEPVEASSEAVHVATFEKAIDMLRSVETKPASMFGSAKTSPNDIEQTTAFLQEVARQIAEKRRAT